MCGHLDTAKICLDFLNVDNIILNIGKIYFKNSLNGFSGNLSWNTHCAWKMRRELVKIANFFLAYSNMLSRTILWFAKIESGNVC